MAAYEDPEFPATSASIGPGKHSGANWKRVKDLRGVTDPPTLFGRIEADSIDQGELGDCWLLAAFAAVADFPGHIKSLFSPSTYAEDGRYEIRLYDIGKGWETVVIDDRVPCLPHSGGTTPCFCQVSGGAVWTLLLEKAFAKFSGSYYNLDGGGAAWAFQVLSGIPLQLSFMRGDDGMWEQWSVDVDQQRADAAGWRSKGMKSMCLTTRMPQPKFDNDAFFGLLAYLDQCNCLISASISGTVMEAEREDGLIETHAYSLLDAQMAHGKAMVKLRNPWGSSEWKGPFSDGSPEWDMYPELREDLRLEVEEDGQFWMPWEAFVSAYDSVKVCAGSLPVPKMSRVAGKSKAGIACAHCRNAMSRVWCLSELPAKSKGKWERLDEGDYCFMCRRSHVGLVDFRPCLQRIPGIDSFLRRPRLLQPDAPRIKAAKCSYGPACYRFHPDHYAEFAHPWLRLNFEGKAYAGAPKKDTPAPDSPVDPALADDPAPTSHEDKEPSYDDSEVHEMLNLTKKGAWDECMDLLGSKPGIVNLRPANRNWAAIHRAASDDLLDVIQKLVETHHADPQLPTGDGMTPLQVAVKGGCSASAAYLRRITQTAGMADRPSFAACRMRMEEYADGSESPVYGEVQETDGYLGDNERKVQKLFQAADINEDGALELSEVQALLVAAGLNADEADQILAFADQNADGYLNIEELLHWIFCRSELAVSTLATLISTAPDQP
eukprot:TRINITY_DN31080_c0_g1_i1.p1 TRINITY_DN31080_c0_g1~~TRINITY_DN31080_c0_g1_i1.p1  ORF type:complete len:719 (+),score=97.22 TRINITY_DN31080_c0_g1_i1:94-2250(+)